MRFPAVFATAEADHHKFPIKETTSFFFSCRRKRVSRKADDIRKEKENRAAYIGWVEILDRRLGRQGTFTLPWPDGSIKKEKINHRLHPGITVIRLAKRRKGNIENERCGLASTLTKDISRQNKRGCRLCRITILQ